MTRGLLAVGAMLAASTALVHSLGGAPHAAVHVFYFPIIYAAARFGRGAGVATALVAGILCGPLMPEDVSTGTPQPVSSWAVRLALFVAVSLVVQWLTRQEPRPLNEMLRDVISGQRLRRAISSGRVTAHYQPIVDLTTGAVIGAEALCRWPDDRGTFHRPSEFIPAAERTGAIAPLGRHMLSTVTRQAGAWAADPLSRRLVALNISGSQLSDGAFLGELSAVLRRHRLPPRELCLEITETALIRDPARALSTLLEVRRLGVTIALDDFGTGHSSLAYLRDFPIDLIKIDLAFVADVDRDPTSRSLVLAINEMAKALGASVIAEGIERPSQLETLRALGCRYGQGWLLGRPVPAEAATPRPLAWAPGLATGET